LSEDKPGRRDFLKTTGLSALGVVCWSPVRPTNAKEPMSGVVTDQLVYVGTYTTGKSEGIYVYRMNAKSGQLTTVATVKGVTNPSFLIIDKSGRRLFCVNEMQQFNGKPGGAISSFAVDRATGNLKFLSQRPSLGADPCHLVLDNTGKYVIAANYTGGSVVVLPVLQDGSLGAATDFIQHKGSSVNRDRQEGPHAHCVAVDPANRFVLVADLGLDKIMTYRLNPSEGRLGPNDPPWVDAKPGSGPRHIVFHPNGTYLYSVNELDSTVTAFSWDSQRGALKSRQTVSALPAGFSGSNTCAEIELTPSGRYLYASNRGHDSLAIFSVNSNDGSLNLVGRQATLGKTPRSFGIDSEGKFLVAANQGTDSLVSFQLDSATGKLDPVGQKVEVPSPVCVQFMPG
jgi:6-phosphogluconolactonase